MMQEEELVIKDRYSERHHGHSENQNLNNAQDILPFTISDGIYDDSERKYSITLFEIFVTVVVMLSTISGGYLEGYMSPALPSLIKPVVMVRGNDQPIIFNTTFKNSDGGVESNNNNNNNLEFNNEISNSSNSNVFVNITTTTTAATTIFITSTTTTTNSAALSNITDSKKSFLAKKLTDNNETESVELNFASSDATNPVEATEETVSAFDVNTTEISPFSMDNNETTNILELLPTPLPLLNSSDESQNFTTKLYITEEEGSWLGSLLLLGAALGSAVSPWVIKYGRRHAIIASGAPRLLGWLLTIFSTSVYTFYIGRFVCGISIGAISAAIPIYISEVAHPSLRGTLSCIIILGVNFGMFIAAFFGTFLDWNGLAVLGAVFVVAYFVPSFCIPNSPSWLALQGKEEDARNSLRRLRRKGWAIEDELQQILTIAEKVSREKSIPWKCLFVEKRSLLPLVVVTLVTVVNRFSGYNAIITYCSIFIREAVPSASEYWSNVAICLVQVFATVGAMVLVDSWGRRKLLLLSVGVMGASLVFVAICEGVVPIREGGTWVAVLATMVYVSSYSLGIGPLTWVLMGELFPLDAREKASALVSVLNWLLAFVVTKTYFSLESSVGIIGICLVYASVCLIGGGTLFFLVPETKGKSLAEIEAHFSSPQKGLFPSIRKFDRNLSSILDQEAATIDTYSTFH